MDFFASMNGSWESYIIIPLFIFFARIFDVSLGTIRIILVSKGYKILSPILGFFEVLIWIIAIGQIVQNLSNFTSYLAYAFGFAAGTYIGIYLENKISLGNVLVRVITQKEGTELLEYLRTNKYVVTSVDGQGNIDDVKVFFLVIKRSQLNKLTEIIHKFNPQAFYSVEDVRYVSKVINYGESPDMTKRYQIFRILLPVRK